MIQGDNNYGIMAYLSKPHDGQFPKPTRFVDVNATLTMARGASRGGAGTLTRGRSRCSGLPSLHASVDPALMVAFS
jgi:hypothetical protein